MTQEPEFAADPTLTSTQVLQDVAKIIDAHPERHLQDSWIGILPSGSAPGCDLAQNLSLPESYLDAIESGDVNSAVFDEGTCNTVGCVCGWAAMSVPAAVLREAIDRVGTVRGEDDDDIELVGFEPVGAMLLGLDEDLAASLFDGHNPTEGLADALRDISLLAPEERTLRGVIEAGIFDRYPAGVTGDLRDGGPVDLSNVHPDSRLSILYVAPDSKLPQGYQIFAEGIVCKFRGEDVEDHGVRTYRITLG